MTQETKLTEPVQVGLWYETKAGAIVKIIHQDNDRRHPMRANSGHEYPIDGRYSSIYPHEMDSEKDLIRCLGADPFKQVQDVFVEPVEQLNEFQIRATTYWAKAYASEAENVSPVFDKHINIIGEMAIGNIREPKPEPTAPTQFERIFTAVLQGAMACPSALYGRTPKHLITTAIEYTQEAIKQLKQIEGA